MTLIATEAKRLSNVVKQELWPDYGYNRAVLTAPANCKPGTVIFDGEDVAGVAMAEAAEGADVLALVRGPAVVSKGGLIATDVDAAAAALEAKGIQVSPSI